MYITLELNNVNEDKIILHEPVKNILRADCDFIKVLFSDKNITLNGLYINIKLKNVEIVKKRIDLYKLKIDKEINNEIIKELINVEGKILGMLNNKLTKVYTLKTELLKIKLIKLHGVINGEVGIHDNYIFVLRIFGIWKDDVRCGLNYQIIPKSDRFITLKN